LKSLTVDVVKIDGSFVMNVADNPDNLLFIQTLLNLAEGFGIKTVAECVERVEDAELLKNEGVSYLQGYYYGKPQIQKPVGKLAARSAINERDDEADGTNGASAMHPLLARK